MHSQITAAWVCSTQDNEPEKATGDVWRETKQQSKKKEIRWLTIQCQLLSRGKGEDEAEGKGMKEGKEKKQEMTRRFYKMTTQRKKESTRGIREEKIEIQKRYSK